VPEFVDMLPEFVYMNPIRAFFSLKIVLQLLIGRNQANSSAGRLEK
jgi:hypothetical protein